eukprot:1864751-Prymnesium_polylepis.2
MSRLRVEALGMARGGWQQPGRRGAQLGTPGWRQLRFGRRARVSKNRSPSGASICSLRRASRSRHRQRVSPYAELIRHVQQLVGCLHAVAER